MRFSSSKYIASEISLLPHRGKKWAARAAAIFPNSYPNGMSNLGFLTLFSVMHDFPQLLPQRFFFGLTGSLEEGANLSAFPIIAVSIPYEMDYFNLISILRQNEIAIYAQERRKRIIIVGGAATTINPIPISKIADAIFIGQGREFISDIISVLANNPPGTVQKDAILNELSQISGVWVPASGKPIPKRAYSSEEQPLTSPIVSSFASFPNMALVQIQQGCPYDCPFCATPKIYNPFINFTADAVIDKLSMWQGKIFRVGLVGSAIAEHPELRTIVESLATKGIEVSTSSLRIDRRKKSIIDALMLSKQRTVTFAPEAGSYRMKKAIGKKIYPEDVVWATEMLGANEVKLYYIIGLPEETNEDVSAIADEVQRIVQNLPKQRITISVNAFIPKRRTRWETEKMMAHSEIVSRFRILASLLGKFANVRLNVNYKRRMRLQWALSCGGEEIADALANAKNYADFAKQIRKNGWDV